METLDDEEFAKVANDAEWFHLQQVQLTQAGVASVFGGAKKK